MVGPRKIFIVQKITGRSIYEKALSISSFTDNYGYVSNPERKKYNSYQTAVPVHLIENSYWLAWTLRLATKYWGNSKFDSRQFKLGRWDGHWDGYDVWINFLFYS